MAAVGELLSDGARRRPPALEARPHRPPLLACALLAPLLLLAPAHGFLPSGGVGVAALGRRGAGSRGARRSPGLGSPRNPLSAASSWGPTRAREAHATGAIGGGGGGGGGGGALGGDAEPAFAGVTDPEELPPLVMKALAMNDFPEVDSGLRAAWDLSGETTKFVFQHNYTDFVESAHETALGFPTSFYGMAMYGRGWEMEGSINLVGAQTKGDEKCWIATQVMTTEASDGRVRRWQWELRKRRRPPHMNTWFVESIGSSDKDGKFEPDD